MTWHYQLERACLELHSGSSRHCALDQISVRIVPGERVALVGANGSGKSSLLRLMHGLLLPTTGVAERKVGLRQAMLFQRPVLLRVSLQSNLALAFWLNGTPWRQARSRAASTLEQAGMGDLAARSGRHLSVGQTQRVALARALALEPQALLLDEPTASLDPYSKRLVEDTVRDYQGTVVFASHNLGQVKRLASRVLYLEQGRLLADLPVAQFFNADALQACSQAAANFLKGEIV